MHRAPRTSVAAARRLGTALRIRCLRLSRRWAASTSLSLGFTTFQPSRFLGPTYESTIENAQRLMASPVQEAVPTQHACKGAFLASRSRLPEEVAEGGGDVPLHAPAGADHVLLL